MKVPRILSLGEVLWDLFPQGARFGGAPANLACHAAIQGADVAIVSAVGDDERGREALHILRGYGMDVRLVQVAAGFPTGTVGIELDARGSPTFTIHEGSAWDHVTWQPEMESAVCAATAICFGTLGQRAPRSRTTIRRCLSVAERVGLPRVLDVNLRRPFFDRAMIRESMTLASMVKLSDEELSQVASAWEIASPTRQAPEETLQRLADMCQLECVVMTCGAEGALLVTRNEVIRQPGFPVSVVDSVGAGDAFTAAFLLGWLRNETPRQNLRHACEVAAHTCTHAGAVPSPASTG